MRLKRLNPTSIPSKVFHVCSRTVGVSSWDPAMSTAASHPRSGCLAAGWWQSWSWRGWTRRPPVLPPLLSSPSTHTQRKAMSALRVLSRSARIHKSSTPIQYLNRRKLLFSLTVLILFILVKRCSSGWFIFIRYYYLRSLNPGDFCLYHDRIW